MSEEKFKTTSGKEITVHISEQGEPERISWETPIIGEENTAMVVRVGLTENEFFDIKDKLEELEEE